MFQLDIINTATYQIIKRIPVVSPFSPNIFKSPDGKWIAMTHKDVGKVTVINTARQEVTKVINTGPITNHVTFCYIKNKLTMLVTVGGENKVRVYDVNDDFKQTDTIKVGALPHGLWPSKDGKLMYAGLEYGDEVQGINLETMTALLPVKIGQSPQALIYADDAVTGDNNISGLTALNDTLASQAITLTNATHPKAIGRIDVRSIGLTDLVEQIFNGLQPSHAYTLALSSSDKAPYHADYEINAFTTDNTGKFLGQSTGLIKSNGSAEMTPFKKLVLIDNATNEVELLSQ